MNLTNTITYEKKETISFSLSSSRVYNAVAMVPIQMAETPALNSDPNCKTIAHSAAEWLTSKQICYIRWYGDSQLCRFSKEMECDPITPSFLSVDLFKVYTDQAISTPTELWQKKAAVGRDLVVVWDHPPVEEKLAVDEDVYTPPLP